jgi:hypothetical protein
MPLFMIGTQRSGSNLLRLMLNQLPAVAAPHPPHILQRLMPLVKQYGDLTRPDNFASLVDDVCRLVELNPVPWEGVVLNRIEILKRVREPSLVAVFGAVYDVYAEGQKAKTWCCKSLANIQYLDEIERYFGNQAKYIYLYRDGRDVALSFRKAVVGEKHAYHIAREWGVTQRLALSLRERIDPRRFISLSYEALTGEPETTMRRLCEFLGERFDESMLAFHESSEAKRAAESSDLWGNVTRPVMRDNTGKFLRELSAEDIRVFESVSGDVLDTLGYARVAVTRGKEAIFTNEELVQFEKENKRLKEAVMQSVDADDLKRRDRQAALLEEIRARHKAGAPVAHAG